MSRSGKGAYLDRGAYLDIEKLATSQLWACTGVNWRAEKPKVKEGQFLCLLFLAAGGGNCTSFCVWKRKLGLGSSKQRNWRLIEIVQNFPLCHIYINQGKCLFIPNISSLPPQVASGSLQWRQGLLRWWSPEIEWWDVFGVYLLLYFVAFFLAVLSLYCQLLFILFELRSLP